MMRLLSRPTGGHNDLLTLLRTSPSHCMSLDALCLLMLSRGLIYSRLGAIHLKGTLSKAWICRKCYRVFTSYELLRSIEHDARAFIWSTIAGQWFLLLCKWGDINAM
ncbi:hypothetical protein P692DRAFT_20848618 [Suillus brevipes Sb2]|nr:hypothetical protein P692DRAFT_20848618 [Suillus brevipes Sb2]